MKSTTPDVRETCDLLITVIDGLVGDLTELLYSVRSIRLEADAKANDSTPRDRYVSPMGDRREQACRCYRCRSFTWALLDGLCDACWENQGGAA